MDKFKISLFPNISLIFGIFALMLIVFFLNSLPSIQKFGIELYTTNVWKAYEYEHEERYGLLAAIYGSVYTSVIALLISIPLSIGFAIFVVDFAPKKIKEPLIVITDVMAGLPTILYGIWGLFVLAPFLRDYIMIPLYKTFSYIPLFSYPPTGYCYFTAGVLLAIMVTPFATAIVRESYRMVPRIYKEGAFALGLTKYETTKILLKYIKPAIVAGTLLAFGRAIGETVAVSLVVGNTFNVHPSLFAPGYTISSLIANQFGNAFIYDLMPSTLFAAGLSLFLIGLSVNLLGLQYLKRWRYA
ncbi:MAG: phosphate ABC transporter permease subunit PstC [Archaeoglobaceae archaeon]|nr:phosphate ABC transporter permease subunit PstC [Archaeoglobaceae archaeon]MCX8152380.1 phosphate ABC transporter permease subunit PstC [Archaeoglobaceae archaeon]MDW8013720.1 phosphate ABC transporter permease subunit PstC [Archaeoglobaceae archaeon]